MNESNGAPQEDSTTNSSAALHIDKNAEKHLESGKFILNCKHCKFTLSTPQREELNIMVGKHTPRSGEGDDVPSPGSPTL